MDFERIGIKTLFYDFPVEIAVERIQKKDSAGFLKDFLCIARKVDISFTESEIELLQRNLDEIWAKIDNETLKDAPIYVRCLQFLFRISKNLLDIDQNSFPKVQFSQLLRWRMFAHLLGEDVMTSAYLAMYDNLHDLNRNSFYWSDVLQHNNEFINRELAKGLSDIHMHYGASSAIFNLNWLSMMNMIDRNRVFDEDSRFYYLQKIQTSVINGSQQGYSLRTLWIVAAYLRVLLYKLVREDFHLSSKDFNKIKRLLDDEMFRNLFITEIQSEIDSIAESSFRSKGYGRIDYALHNNIGREAKDSIHILECGERWLLYKFFSYYLNGKKEVWQYADCFYLYLLIKNRIRQEFEHTNSLNGFLNFKHYQDRKTSVTNSNDLINKMYPSLMAQTSVFTTNDKLEIRLSNIQLNNLKELHFNQNVVTGKLNTNTNSSNITFVYSFGKGKFDKSITQNNIRFAALRNNLKKTCLLIKEYLNYNQPILLTGIDAAGNELNCRPEVFAHAYRFIQKLGSLGRTYHVGEDFYDLIDGMRAIDEACTFLQMRRGDRLGHVLALGVNVYRYYELRRRNVVIPRQNLLDNYIWLYQKIRLYNIEVCPSLLLDIEEKASALYYKIGYTNFSIQNCWHAWLLRGDDDTTATNSMETLWNQTRFCDKDSIKIARENKFALEIVRKYNYDTSIKKHGFEIVEDRLPLGTEPILEQLQKCMIKDIAALGIFIECNPTSNLCIGPFEKYEELPLFKFYPMENNAHSSVVNVSINTDDRGVFATSLYNEFSLVAAALFKQKDSMGNRLWNDNSIYDYISRLRENGNNHRFSKFNQKRL